VNDERVDSTVEAFDALFAANPPFEEFLEVLLQLTSRKF
jgi:hypothetical protein